MRFSVRRTLVLVVAAALALASTGVAAARAGADELADKRSEAEQISRRLGELDTRMELLGEEYNVARVRLDEVQADIDRATRRVADANAELERARRDLAGYAVAAYVKGGESDLPEILLRGDGPQVSRQIEYLQVASSNRRQMVDDFRAARSHAGAELTDLQADRAAAEALRGDLEQKRADTRAAAREQQALLDRVTGEMAQLVADAQARQAAADEQAARARLVSTGAVAPSGPTPSKPSGPASGPTSPSPTAPRPGPTTPSPTGPPPTTPPVTAPPPPSVPPTPPPPVLSIAARAVALAKTQLGKPYVWAGADPAIGFDCSGLVMWAYRGAGKNLPHSSQLQYQVTRRISLNDLAPGDLLFYGSPIHHVGMYVGGGQMIEAPREGVPVRIAGIYRSDLVGAGRVV